VNYYTAHLISSETSYMLFKIKQKLFANVANGAGFNISVQLQNFTNFCCVCMYIMLLNIIDELECETNLILLSTQSHIHLLPNGDVLGLISESLPRAPKF